MDPSTLKKIAEEFGTPSYVYYEERLINNYREFYSAFKKRYPSVKVLYAYKANTSLALCTLLKKEGAGADVVSGGELATARKIGLAGADIMYTNNSKSPEEIGYAIDSGAIINADSVPDLMLIQGEAKKRKKTVKISFRINPGVDPKTHAKIATGLKGSKFGVHIEEDAAFNAYKTAAGLDHIKAVGVQTHIGSQITEVAPFVDSAEKMMEFALRLKKDLHIKLEYVDLGGGLGIPYRDEKTAKPEDYAAAVVPVIEKWNKLLGYEPALWLEPGRYLVANTGMVLARVQTVKETPYKKFINTDAGFNTLIRPAMYDAYHRIELVGKEKEQKTELYDVAGNVCESGDLFAKDRMLPKAQAGDLLAIMDAGAYGYSMASRYNTRLMPPEVLIRSNGKYELIREREKPEEHYKYQRIPKDLL
ncbi:MAG: diaminopimelate decarboxylase [Candidatus Altiarchaeia archaeon]